MRKSTSILLLLAALIMKTLGLFLEQHVNAQPGTAKDTGNPYTAPTDNPAP
jgi:hypothetical protein